MSSITLLGPQYREPNLRYALRELGIAGPLVAITAGWQEREGETEELREHCGADVADLQLYARTEEVFAKDPTLQSAHRRRQARLSEMQDLYRLQLEHAKDAARELFAREGDPVLVRRARRSSLGALRRLDREHLRALEREHAEHRRELRPQQRASVISHIDALRRLIDPAAAVLIAGGHVAVLANRLRLFDLRRLLAGKPIIAWSAGAMTIAERIILFHDHPPQGAGSPEVFDAGLGLLREVVPLPHAQTRLSLHDHERLMLLARRFAPAQCLTLDHGSALHWHSGVLKRCASVWRLSRQGILAELRAS